jgi:uncharacterized membrane protein YdjX (TVP38/TMEM64 family)
MDNKIFTSQTFRFVLFLIFMGIFIAFGWIFHVDVDHLKTYLAQFPLWLSGPIFIALYIAFTFFIWIGPRDVFRLAAAVLYGPMAGSGLVWCAEMISAVLLFQMSRVLGQGYVENKFGWKKEKSAETVNPTKPGFAFFAAFTLRLNPLVPFRFQDLGAGLTSIALPTYMSAICVSSYIRILWLQFFLVGVGAAVFGNAAAVQTYLLNNPFLLLYTAVYFFVVMLTSTVLAVAAAVKRRNGPRRPA